MVALWQEEPWGGEGRSLGIECPQRKDPVPRLFSDVRSGPGDREETLSKGQT